MSDPSICPKVLDLTLLPNDEHDERVRRHCERLRPGEGLSIVAHDSLARLGRLIAQTYPEQFLWGEGCFSAQLWCLDLVRASGISGPSDAGPWNAGEFGNKSSFKPRSFGSIHLDFRTWSRGGYAESVNRMLLHLGRGTVLNVDLSTQDREWEASLFDRGFHCWGERLIDPRGGWRYRIWIPLVTYLGRT